jgi:hypothetical protein
MDVWLFHGLGLNASNRYNLDYIFQKAKVALTKMFYKKMHEGGSK